MSEAVNGKQLFIEAVSVVLRGWPALRMVVDQSFGGSLSRQKAAWLEEVTAQWFWENEAIQADELKEYLATLLNQEFDTILEDGSLPMVSEKICLLFQQCNRGSYTEVQQFIAQKAEENGDNPPPREPAAKNKEEEGEEEEMEQEQGNILHLPQLQGNGEGEEKEEEEGGWEVVSRSRRRR